MHDVLTFHARFSYALDYYQIKAMGIGEPPQRALNCLLCLAQTQKIFRGITKFTICRKNFVSSFVKSAKICCSLQLSLPLFIFCKNRFSKNLVFLTDIVADMAMCYTLCHGILWVPTVYLLKHYSLPSEIQCCYLYINFLTECHHNFKRKISQGFYIDLFKICNIK